jgi:CRISPR type IV-associated protein Csf3
MPEYNGLRVTATLRTPVAYQGLLLLDGIMSFSAERGGLCADYYDSQGLPAGAMNDTGFRSSLPLAKWGYHERADWGNRRTTRWVWLASAASHDGCERVARWHKKWDDEYDYLVDFGTNCGRVTITNGHFKSFDMPIIIHATPRLDFIAYGDAERVRTMLARVTHVGKKASQGFGEVLRWEVEEDSTLTKTDVAMRRPVPVEVAPDPNSQRVWICPRPPYWCAQYACECAMGGV